MVPILMDSIWHDFCQNFEMGKGVQITHQNQLDPTESIGLGQFLGVGRLGCVEVGFATKVKIVEMNPKTPFGFVKFVCYWKVKPKICNAKYTKVDGALWKEKPKQNETQNAEIYIYIYIYISQKFQPTVNERGKLREVLSKKGRVPLYQYFHLQASKLSKHLVAGWAFVSKF